MGGIRFSFPVVNGVPKRHIQQNRYSSTGSVFQDGASNTGQQKSTSELESNTVYNKVQRKVWDLAVRSLQKNQEAAKLVAEMDFTDLVKQFPEFTLSEINEFYSQFRAFDLNHDGNICITELNCMLDVLKDTSTPEERLQYFREVDVDNSGGIDFDEFVVLVSNVRKGESKAFWGLYSLEADRIDRVRKQMAIRQQVESGLF